MEHLFYSTGQAARELGITQARVRDLCRSGAIQAEMTDGGQFRIPREVLDKLKREGAPTPPRPMPTGGQTVTVIPAPSRRGHPALLAEPSEDVIDSAEEVVCMENELKSLGLRRQKEEQLDWFRERENRDAERATKRREAEQRRQEELAEERRHQNWKTEWLQYGLNQVPYEAPQSVQLDVHEAVVQALDRLAPSHPASVVQQLVGAAVDRALTPWRAAKQIADAIKDACESWDVPWDMRHDSTWNARMYQAAGAAVGRLRNGATLNEAKVAASEAVAAVVQAFEHGSACAEMVKNVWMKVSGGTSEEWEQGKDAVRAALAQLPIGASKREIEKARDSALEPIRNTVAARQDREMRDGMLQWVELRCTIRRLSHEAQQRALTEIREAFNQLPIGTAKATLDRTIDVAIDRHYGIQEQHEREKREAARREAEQQQKRRDAEFKANQHIGHIQKYLEKEYEFDGGSAELRREAERLREPVREGLIAELLKAPNMEASQIREFIEELADEHL
jgi:excisionase family DNA binding protein